jgi:hypothetical protein
MPFFYKYSFASRVNFLLALAAFYVTHRPRKSDAAVEKM